MSLLFPGCDSPPHTSLAMVALCASTWGDPTATKRVLLLHGILGSSQSWHRIAQEFASRGYFVMAPDLLGHGNGRRSSDYTIAALAEELRPLFVTPGSNSYPYDIVVGYSLGGVVASTLLPLLKSTRPVQVVLVDPPLEQSPESVAYHRKIFVDIVRTPKTTETYLREWPHMTKEDAIMFSLSVRLCDITVVEGILDQNVPWSFSHHLSTIPDNVKVTALAADPSNLTAPACMRVEDVEPYPLVTVRTVWGASHLIPVEFPLVVVETALGGTEAQN